MNKIKPYNDKKLTLNDNELYELTIQEVKDQLGNPYNDDATLSLRIKRNTRKVYNYIFNNAFSGNRKTIISIINHTEEYRKMIYDALLSQMESDMASGYNDQDLYVADNLDQRNMQHINEVSVQTEMILDNSVGYGGINIMYRGAFPLPLVMEFK